MEADLRELGRDRPGPHLRRLLAEMLGADSPTWAQFRDARRPALSPGLRHGLLEHSLTVAQAVSATLRHVPGIDRDVAVTGALLHDVGKLDTYEFTGDAIVMSRPGPPLRGDTARVLPGPNCDRDAGTGSPPIRPRRWLHIILSVITARSSTAAR